MTTRIKIYLRLAIISAALICNSEHYSRNNNKFYIYPWPDDITNRWPKAYTHHRLSMGEGFDANYGVGKLKNASEGLYHTHQYSLFKTFYFRLLESSHRTVNAHEASLFFIPYDIGMDSSTRREDGALFRTSCPMLSKVLESLKTSDAFIRRGGADHFLLLSINQMMTYYVHMQCMELYKMCFNCTKLAIDAYPREMFTLIDKYEYLRHRWVSIPFPSNYHISSAVTVPPWRSHYTISGVIDPARTHALAYMGSTAVTARLQRQLRLVLQEQCSKSPECLFVPLSSHDSQTDIFRSLTDKGPYSTARLCLMPGGDFPTRKGVLDALLAGCVPVMFQLQGAHTQWPWHWNTGDGVDGADACLIYVPRERVMSNPEKAIDRLVRMSKDTVLMRKKLQCIARVGYRMQYNVPSGRRVPPTDSSKAASSPPPYFVKTLSLPEFQGRGTDASPLEAEMADNGLPQDAVDVVLQHLLTSSDDRLDPIQ